jgi:hypothetical protein
LVPLTEALVQEAGGVVAELERPTCTAVPAGETFPPKDNATPALPEDGGLVIEMLAVIPVLPPVAARIAPSDKSCEGALLREGVGPKAIKDS